MKTVKGWSARLIFKKYPYIKEELWGGEFWSDGGHIDTVSEKEGVRANKELCKGSRQRFSTTEACKL
jgi:REP element-mobilizing transposase RayT